MKEQELFARKAQGGYKVCFTAQCPLREQCLRWKVGQQMPTREMFCVCVNPLYPDVATARCPLYRQAEKVQMARGMIHIFTDEMPKRIESYVRKALMAALGRTYFFEYRNGTRLIPPTMQQEIRDVFREAGWNEPVEFDGYVEEYEW